MRTLVALASVAAVLSTPAAAWALFSVNGSSATATYTAAVLPTPTISATSVSGTVTLTLTSTGGTVAPLSYTITASPAGGAGTGGTCQSSYTPASSLPSNCTYTGVAAGSYAYSLTAVYNTWTQAGTGAACVAGTPAAVINPPSASYPYGPLEIDALSSTGDCGLALSYDWDCESIIDQSQCLALLPQINAGTGATSFIFDLELGDDVTFTLNLCYQAQPTLCEQVSTVYMGLPGVS
jgi:hypothetical protein